MNVLKPIWYLKEKTCPVCDGQGRLEFFCCPNCKEIILVCEEDGSVFTDIESVTLKKVFGNQFCEELLCKNCKAFSLGKFDYATDVQLLENAITSSNFV